MRLSIRDSKEFDMIQHGKIKEIHININPYFTVEFKKVFDFSENGGYATNMDIHSITFQKGYGMNIPEFDARCILEIGQGKEEMGTDPEKQYYILKILEVMK